MSADPRQSSHKNEGGQKSSMKDKKSLATGTMKLYLVGEERKTAETQDEIKAKTAFENLEQSFKLLTSRKIKDKLSAFLPDIPGDLDATPVSDSTLRAVIDRPPVGGERELVPLSELQGFKLLPGALPEPYRRSFPKEAIRHERKKKHKHKKLEVKKHEAAAAAAAAEQPHLSSLESSTGTSADSHIPSGHMIPGVGIGQVITTAQTSGMKPLAGAVDPLKKKRNKKRKHEATGEGDGQNGQQIKKKKKDKSKKKDKEKDKHLTADQASVQITSSFVPGHAPL
ncbi:mediator of RNA polymerase II transcription subunit 19-like [Dysidea avara]|uniref:mediator of RNA polymerase II transcription subunit 19-like n=1 Tax=Dysidea avara TaxID=196820 RepID=UPI00331A453A